MIVHFPIACLTGYAILELVSFIVPRRREKLLLTKEILLFVGVAGAWAALQTGEMAAGWEPEAVNAPLVLQKHAQAAEMTYSTFGFLAAWYVLKIIVANWRHTAPAGLVSFLSNKWAHLLIVLLALFGLMMVTVTGALGGAMVYWPDADPAVSVIYDIVVGK